MGWARNTSQAITGSYVQQKARIDLVSPSGPMGAAGPRRVEANGVANTRRPWETSPIGWPRMMTPRSTSRGQASRRAVPPLDGQPVDAC
jgi:hypothetical protein